DGAQAGRAIGILCATPATSVERFLAKHGLSVFKIRKAMKAEQEAAQKQTRDPIRLPSSTGVRVNFCCLISPAARDALRAIADREKISIAEAGSRHMETILKAQTDGPAVP